MLLISADSALPYHRPPLSKDYLRGQSQDDELPLEPAEFYAEHGIEVWLGAEVVGLDLDARAVATRDGRVVAFDRCVLATGSVPSLIDVPGATEALHRLRFVDQARELRAAAEHARTAVVIGSGFIGCEAAASLALRGIEVVQLAHDELPQQPRLGDEAGQRILAWLMSAGVDFRGGVEVAEIDGSTVVTAAGDRFDADLVLCATGIAPKSALAEQAGLKLDTGRILVDERMATSVAGIYAAGDVTLAFNPTAGRRLLVEHWGEAIRMGEVAGTNAAGGTDRWTDVPGFWSTIGDETLKYAAWGDGYDTVRFVDYSDGAFTVFYGRDEVVVGVLTHGADDDYDRGRELIEAAAPFPSSSFDPARSSTTLQ